jgi:hypothetical protein
MAPTPRSTVPRIAGRSYGADGPTDALTFLSDAWRDPFARRLTESTIGEQPAYLETITRPVYPALRGSR